MANVLGKLKTTTGPWFAAAVIVIAAFMYWLYAASSTVDSGVASDLALELPRIADTTFASNPQALSGQRILVTPVPIAARLGYATVTADLPSLLGYPLILDRPIVESGLSVEPGDILVIAGSVYALTDSLLDVYAQRGFFDVENRPSLEAHSTFFLVDSLDYFVGQSTPSGEDTTTAGRSESSAGLEDRS